MVSGSCASALLLSLLASLLSSVSAAATPLEAKNETSGPLTLPPLKRLSSHSFRGPLAADGRIPNWDVSGYASRIGDVPCFDLKERAAADTAHRSSNDFLRLVPPTSLSHGAAFSAPFTSGANGWVVEVGFRVHGRGETGSGGRGLALWYTKTGNPTSVTLPSDARKAPSPPPADVLASKAGDDASTSFFGSRTTFDGLGIVFDTSASKALLGRSQYRSEQVPAALRTAGADGVGVISALVDDGSAGGRKGAGFLNAANEERPEAAYLEASQDECEAGFRNAPGLVWARISYLDQRIRVDLDLTPHTTLSTAARVFTHHCLTVNNVKLPSGFHFGLSALASNNEEPDAVDVYAFDAFEVVADASADEYSRAAAADARVGETQRSLAGTSRGDGMDGFDLQGRRILIDLIKNQARMLNVLDTLSQRVDALTTQFAPSGSVSQRLQNIEGRLGGLDTSALGAGLQSSSDGVTLRDVLSAVEKVDTDLANLRGRVDGMSNAIQGSLQTARTRIGDLFNSWQRTQTAVETEFERNRIAREEGRKSRLPGTGTLFVVIGCLLAILGLRALGEAKARRTADENELGTPSTSATSGVFDYFSGPSRRRPKKMY